MYFEEQRGMPKKNFKIDRSFSFLGEISLREASQTALSVVKRSSIS